MAHRVSSRYPQSDGIATPKTYPQVPLGNILKSPRDPLHDAAANEIYSRRRDDMSIRASPVKSVKMARNLKKARYPPAAEAKLRADYRVKYAHLRRAWGDQMEVPEVSDREPLENIAQRFESLVKGIRVNSSVEKNKMYLLVFWMLLEYFGVSFLKLPIENYTKRQMKIMRKYENTLIAIGEKAADADGEGWAPEVQLVLMALFNCLMMIGLNYLGKKIGPELAENVGEYMMNILSDNRTEDILRQAEEADSINPPENIPMPNGEAPMGEMGAMLPELMKNLPTILPLLKDLMGGSSNQQQKPEVKRPTGFAARRKQRNTPAPTAPTPGHV